MTYSNLSKIRPKLRTTGRVSGNFGKSKVTAGSTLNDIGGDGNIGATQDEYLNRLYFAFDNTDDNKLKQFLYQEIKKIHIQRGTWYIWIYRCWWLLSTCCHLVLYLVVGRILVDCCSYSSHSWYSNCYWME
jgi:hypothetical protein